MEKSQSLSLPAESVSSQNVAALANFVLSNSGSKDAAIELLQSARDFLGEGKSSKRQADSSNDTHANKISKVESDSEDVLVGKYCKDITDQGTVTLCMAIPEDMGLISSIIGKSGSFIIDVHKKSNAKIQVEKARAEPGAIRCVFLQGNLPEVCLAYQLIHKRMEDKAPSLRAAGAFEVSKIVVPNEFVGRIIGKSGAVVKRIEVSSHSRMEFQSDNDMLSTFGGYFGRTITISGNYLSRMHGIYLMMRQLLSEKELPETWKTSGTIPPLIPSRFSASGGPPPLPGPHSGMLYGPTPGVPHPPPGPMGPPGAHYNPGAPAAPPLPRMNEVMGPPMGMGGNRPPPMPAGGSANRLSNMPVGSAGSAVANISSQRGLKNEPSTVQIKVPSGSVHMIIGKGGSAIQEMERMTSCSVLVDKTQTGADRLITIQGTSVNTTRAVELVRHRVQEWEKKEGLVGSGSASVGPVGSAQVPPGPPYYQPSAGSNQMSAYPPYQNQPQSQPAPSGSMYYDPQQQQQPQPPGLQYSSFGNPPSSWSGGNFPPMGSGLGGLPMSPPQQQYSSAGQPYQYF